MSKYDDSFRKLAWFKLTGEDDKNFKYYNLICSVMCISSLFIFSAGFYYWIETKDTGAFILSCVPATATRIYLDYFLKKGPDFAKQLYIESVRLHREFEQHDADLATFIYQKRKQFIAEHAGWEHFLSD